MPLKSLHLFLTKFVESEYRRGFAYIFSSKLLIAFVTFLTTPFLARLFEPAEYGLFALMTSIAAITAILSNLTLPASLLVIDKEKVVISSIDIILFSSVLTSFFALSAIVVINLTSIDFSTEVTSPIYAIALISVSSFLITATQILANINIRLKNFGNNVAVNLVDNFSLRIASLLLGFLGQGMYGLFYSELLGKSANLMTQLYLKTISVRTFASRINFKAGRIVRTIVENRNYPLYNLPVSLIASFSGQLILWILVLGFSKADVGYFTMAIGILNIPLILFSNSIQPLLTSKLFENKTQMQTGDFLSLTAKLFGLSITVYLLIFLLCPIFVEFYLGDKWLPSISLIQIMCFPFALQLLGNSISGGFLVFKKQRANLVIKLIFLLVLLLGCYILISHSSDLKSVISYYAIIFLFEEIAKVTYLSLQLHNVKNR